LAGQLLLRPSAPGIGAAGLGWPPRECGRCTAGAARAGSGEQSGAAPRPEHPHVVELGPATVESDVDLRDLTSPTDLVSAAMVSAPRPIVVKLPPPPGQGPGRGCRAVPGSQPWRP